jgi:hypothetical protein
LSVTDSQRGDDQEAVLEKKAVSRMVQGVDDPIRLGLQRIIPTCPWDHVLQFTPKDNFCQKSVKNLAKSATGLTIWPKWFSLTRQ